MFIAILINRTYAIVENILKISSVFISRTRRSFVCLYRHKRIFNDFWTSAFFFYSNMTNVHSYAFTHNGYMALHVK